MGPISPIRGKCPEGIKGVGIIRPYETGTSGEALPQFPPFLRPGGKPADAPVPSPAPAEFPPKLYTEMPRAVEKRTKVKASAKVSRPGAGNMPETPSAARGHPDKIGKKVMKFLQNGQFTPILRFCYTSVQAVDFGGGVWYDTYRGKGSYTGLNA